MNNVKKTHDLVYGQPSTQLEMKNLSHKFVLKVFRRNFAA